MYRRKILRMLKSGASPLNLAIRKWKDMLYIGASDYGGKNCGLCVANTCEKCIIAEQTGLYSCNGTPYQQWIHHHQTEHAGKYPIKIRCPKCVGIVNREIKFLEDLRLKLKMKQLERPLW